METLDCELRREIIVIEDEIAALEGNLHAIMETKRILSERARDCLEEYSQNITPVDEAIRDLKAELFDITASLRMRSKLEEIDDGHGSSFLASVTANTHIKRRN